MQSTSRVFWRFLLVMLLWTNDLKSVISCRWVNQQEAKCRDAKKQAYSCLPGQVIWDMNYSLWRCVWWGVFSGYFVLCSRFSVIGLRLASFPLAWIAFSHLHFHPSSGHTLTFNPSLQCVCVCVCCVCVCVCLLVFVVLLFCLSVCFCVFVYVSHCVCESASEC